MFRRKFPGMSFPVNVVYLLVNRFFVRRRRRFEQYAVIEEASCNVGTHLEHLHQSMMYEEMC
jgi:hypothetical protein